MKKWCILFSFACLLSSCNFNFFNTKDNTNKDYFYGAFLGRSEDNFDDLDNYQNVSIEFDEFSKTTISKLKNKNVNIFAYLNVGSLENYRDYYDDFKHLTFADYENWEDESWIDVGNANWQDYVVDTLATHFKDYGAYGVYLDNVDVYSVAKEKYLTKLNGIKNGLIEVIEGINNLGLKVMVNGGAELFDDLIDEKETKVFDSIFAYHQEEVFSLIEDYENNKFGKQTKEDREYYQYISSKFSEMGKEVFFLEYTTDNKLIKQIKDFCYTKGYHYYIADNIELN